jgi:hypothetical protein
MPGYKHPCRYCNTYIVEESNFCPVCGKNNPLGALPCPKCHAAIEAGWKRCGNCGLFLDATCPKCQKTTFLGEFCQSCGVEIAVVCQKCKTRQPPLSPSCLNCGKPLK